MSSKSSQQTEQGFIENTSYEYGGPSYNKPEQVSIRPVELVSERNAEGFWLQETADLKCDQHD